MSMFLATRRMRLALSSANGGGYALRVQTPFGTLTASGAGTGQQLQPQHRSFSAQAA